MINICWMISWIKKNSIHHHHHHYPHFPPSQNKHSISHFPLWISRHSRRSLLERHRFLPALTLGSIIIANSGLFLGCTQNKTHCLPPLPSQCTHSRKIWLQIMGRESHSLSPKYIWITNGILHCTVNVMKHIGNMYPYYGTWGGHISPVVFLQRLQHPSLILRKHQTDPRRGTVYNKACQTCVLWVACLV